MSHLTSLEEGNMLSRPMLDYVINSTKVRDDWNNLSEWFWSPYFWLPDGVTWDDFKARTDVVHADPTEIWTYPILLAAVFTILRVYVLTPYLSTPLALWLGVKRKAKVIFEPNYSLEKIFAMYGMNVPSNVLEATAKDQALTVREIQVWLRRRKLSEKHTKMDRFNETFFKLIYHVGITVLLAVALYSKPWLSDINQCIIGYPHHSIDSGIWWLYMSALGFYWSLTACQAVYPHGKGNRTEMVHHLSTITLISFSWTCGFFRYGSLILLVHEPTDIPLLMGKLSRYADLEKHTDILFSIFVVFWFFQRGYLFPFWLLKAVIYDSSFNSMSRAVYVQYGFLFLLFLLNVMWAIMVIKIAYKKLVKGDKLKDERSSDEASADENQLGRKVE